MAPGRKSSTRATEAAPDLLRSLGFGPDSFLMNDPKLFLDRAFLAALLVELETELGSEGARSTLFQIGLGHGLRDAERVLRGHFAVEGQLADSEAPCVSTSLSIGLGTPCGKGGRFEVGGSWPEAHEAEARLAKLGRSDSPSCHLSAGYTSGWLTGAHDIDVIAVEIACVANGAPRCEFRAMESADQCGMGADAPAPRASPSSLRTALGHPDGERDYQAEAVHFDRQEDAVHIWGSVMVLPFTTAEEALGTVDMLVRDPATGGVSVVVVDLRDQVIDEGFTAAGLEQVLEQIGAWGAETILTGVSPLSESVVAGLEASYGLTLKDLPNAIASAFQIAEAQRHLL